MQSVSRAIFSERRNAVSFLTFAALAASAFANDPPATPTPVPAPEGFTRFEIDARPEDAATISDFLWRHFRDRGGNGPTLFNKEYLLVADSWLSDAVPRGDSRPIQEVHRAALLEARIDPDGYVHTHQHFSQAHDAGWPFPVWTQAGRGPDEVIGRAAGWHFQTPRAPGWVGDYLQGWGEKGAQFVGEGAVAKWFVADAESAGIVENRWRLRATGQAPTLLSPDDVVAGNGPGGWILEAEQAPWIQVRWRVAPPDPPADGTPAAAIPADFAPRLEWMREGDADFAPERRMLVHPQRTELSRGDLEHSHLPMFEHPLWEGRITRLRLTFPGLPAGATIDLDSLFSAYDTRHTINNPIYILACAQQFAWTGDVPFLREVLDRMRLALHYQRTVMGGLEQRVIRVPWPGHDGLAGWVNRPDGTKEIRPGHGVGSNYWDLMPFGHDDFYATYQYHAATLAMADLEEAVARRPEWNLSRGAFGFDPAALRAHAADVRAEANRRFWNPATGRYFASIDVEGKGHDYGYTFLNLDAIWYGVVPESRATEILDWISGRRVVAGDTSTGADIYHWRFAPRATTLRNVEWYGQGWTSPESIPWGGQVQDGGAVLGFTFYDLWARLKVLGADDAWARMKEILAWDREAMAAGGYRAFYADGRFGTTLQGCGTPGGLGIDCEFYESSLFPAIMVRGFLGIDARPDSLFLDPELPAEWTEGGGESECAVRGLRYQGARMDVVYRLPQSCEGLGIEVVLHETPREPIRVEVLHAMAMSGPGGMGTGPGEAATGHTLPVAGSYHFHCLGE